MAKRVMSPPTAGDTGLMKGKEDANREQEFYLDSPSEGGFIAYEREDNWSDHSYDKRYLDALARVLLVSDKKVNPVSAITQVGDRYYLAYNDAKKDNFYKNYKDKLLEILECLNTKNWQKLLALHILHNRVDFLDILETDARFPGESIGLQDLRANLVEDIEVVDATRQAVVLIEKQLKTIEKDSAQLVAVQTIRACLQQTTTTPAYESYIDLVASLVLKAPSEKVGVLHPPLIS